MILNTRFSKKIYMVKVLMSIFVITLFMCTTVYGIGGSDYGFTPVYFQRDYPLAYQSIYATDLYGLIDPNLQKMLSYPIPDWSAPIIYGTFPSPITGWSEYMDIPSLPYTHQVAEAYFQPVQDGSYHSNWLYGGSYNYNLVAEANPQPSPSPIPGSYLSNWLYGGSVYNNFLVAMDPQPSPRPIFLPYFSNWFISGVGIDPTPTPRIFLDMCIGK